MQPQVLELHGTMIQTTGELLSSFLGFPVDRPLVPVLASQLLERAVDPRLVHRDSRVVIDRRVSGFFFGQNHFGLLVHFKPLVLILLS